MPVMLSIEYPAASASRSPAAFSSLVAFRPTFLTTTFTGLSLPGDTKPISRRVTAELPSQTYSLNSLMSTCPCMPPSLNAWPASPIARDSLANVICSERAPSSKLPSKFRPENSKR